MTKEQYNLTQEDENKIYEEVKQYIFCDDEKTKNLVAPVLILVGGQPSAGKSNLVNISSELLKGNAIIINGDDLRFLHPYDKNLYEKFGKESSKYTHPIVAKWAIKALTKAVYERYNVVVESTLRSDEYYHTIKKLQSVNYNVIVRVLAVSELNSKIGIYKRYENQRNKYEQGKDIDDREGVPRFTPLAWHDESYEGMLETIKKIDEEKICLVEVYNRKGVVLYSSDNNANIKTAVEIIEQERNKEWTLEEYKKFVNNNNQLLKKMNDTHYTNKDRLAIQFLNQKAKSKVNIKEISKIAT